MNIGEKICARRKQLGFSQRQLAEIVGVSFQAVQRWEKGKTYPRRETLPKLIGALETTTSWLSGGGEHEKEDVSDIPPDILVAAKDPRVQKVVRMLVKEFHIDIS